MSVASGAILVICCFGQLLLIRAQLTHQRCQDIAISEGPKVCCPMRSQAEHCANLENGDNIPYVKCGTGCGGMFTDLQEIYCSPATPEQCQVRGNPCPEVAGQHMWYCDTGLESPICACACDKLAADEFAKNLNKFK